MKTDLCVIYNSLANYREGIFKLIDNVYCTEWLYGKIPGGIKDMNLDLLSGKKKFIRNIYFCHNAFYWQCNVLSMLSSKHHTFLMLGEERCLSTWFFLILSKLYLSKKVYLWTHGQYGRENSVKRIIQKLFYKLSDGIFVYGNYAKQIMIKNGIDERKMFVIHNSLDYEKQLCLRNSLCETNIYAEHFGNNHPTLIMIGRLNLRKKLNLLIEAVYELKRKGENYNVVLIGDGEDKEALMKLTNKLGLNDCVWFYGACYDEEINGELIYNADMCVVPGDIGLTAIHCMMFGVPVATHNILCWQGPEFEAIHENETGIFFEHDNVHSLVNKISVWFKAHKNRDFIREMCYHEIDTQWNPQFQIKILKDNLR